MDRWVCSYVDVPMGVLVCGCTDGCVGMWMYRWVCRYVDGQMSV